MDVSEEQISALVNTFYTSARQDAELGPVFNSAIADWDHHMQVVADFWSHALLGTTRYNRHPFPAHLSLPIKPEHFDRWLALFVVAADTTLPPPAADKAKARARHMIESFRVGLFPFVDKDGKPSRMPMKHPQ